MSQLQQNYYLLYYLKLQQFQILNVINIYFMKLMNAQMLFLKDTIYLTKIIKYLNCVIFLVNNV